jgi:hypothetical protein
MRPADELPARLSLPHMLLGDDVSTVYELAQLSATILDQSVLPTVHLVPVRVLQPVLSDDDVLSDSGL